jgi:hypothetical protein
MESQFLTSWFDETYQYRIEEGNPKYSPSKIEAVRKDGGNFDDFHLTNLMRQLVSRAFPRSMFEIGFETDEFRRFVRIYVDLAVSRKKKNELNSWTIIPTDEIRLRLGNVQNDLGQQI